MGEEKSNNRRAWALSRAQHDVIRLKQLLELGFTEKAVYHRLRSGRLHETPWRGVYAVGRPTLTRLGFLMAAVLVSGKGAVLSHATAAELWTIRRQVAGDIHVTMSARRKPRAGIEPHYRRDIAGTMRHGIPVTTVADTLVDIRAAEADVIQADKLDLLHVGELRAALDAMAPRGGVPQLKRLIDVHTFVFTDSELERWFVPIALRVGMPRPSTQVWLNGGLVDFWFEELGIVVETDGGRFHRTPMQQTKDRRRDQAHLIAGLLPLRFTHGQIRYAPGEVEAVLRAAVAARAA